MQNLYVLVSIIVLAGALGGFAAYLSESEFKGEQYPLLKRIGLGIAAAFVVPLFLNTISSSLIVDAEEFPTNYLVFAGFCVLAAFSSKTFISTLSDALLDKVSNMEKRQSELEIDVEPFISQGTEPVSIEASVTQNLDIPDSEKEVLRALNNPKYVRRYLKGIASETGRDALEISYDLIELREKGLVGKKKGKDDDLYWITPSGKQYLGS